MGYRRQKAIARQATQLQTLLAHSIAKTGSDENIHPDNQRPIGTDWVWRPAVFGTNLPDSVCIPAFSPATLGRDLSLFHDCPLVQISLRQEYTAQPDRFAIRLETFAFQGSYMSMVLEVPPAICADLHVDHLIRLSVCLDTKQPVTLSARLNAVHGSDVAQLQETLVAEGACRVAEFDLLDIPLARHGVDRFWIDIFIDCPAPSSLLLQEISVMRCQRADI